MRACPGAASAFIAKATHSALVHATSRSLSTRRNHWSSWFQLAKIWVTTFSKRISIFPRRDVVAERIRLHLVVSVCGQPGDVRPSPAAGDAR